MFGPEGMSMDDMREGIRTITKCVCAIDGAYVGLAKKRGVKSNLLWLLYILDDGKPHSQKQICEKWLFPKTTINTLIKECQSEGYVTLQAISGQRRELLIQLTEKGQAYVRHVLRPVYEAEEEVMHQLMPCCPPGFLSWLEQYTDSLKDTFKNRENRKEET